MSHQPRIPPPPPVVSLVDPTSAPSSSSARPHPRTPSTLTPVKYVVFSWSRHPLIKRDRRAQDYLKTVVGSSLGFPLVLSEGSLGRDKPTELYFSEYQCQTMMDGLINKIGPERANQTWRKDAAHDFRRISRMSQDGFRMWSFPDWESVERRFEQLQAANEWSKTVTQHSALLRAQEIVELIQAEEVGKASFVSIDIETWERDHDLVTEVGFAKSTWRNGGFEPMEIRHFVVKENGHLRNGRFCPDARDHFHFGPSETYSAKSLARFLTAELLSPSYPVFLLLHDHRSDLKSLELLGLSTVSFLHASPLPAPKSETKYLDPKGKGRYLLDTQTLYSGHNRQKKQIKLGDAVTQLGISLLDADGGMEGLGGFRVAENRGDSMPHKLKAHNAGNDAWATLAVFWKLMVAKNEASEGT
ncbi:hypothetical protein JCM16303_000024 [Sporobolomyces ruberrimus]